MPDNAFRNIEKENRYRIQSNSNLLILKTMTLYYCILYVRSCIYCTSGAAGTMLLLLLCLCWCLLLRLSFFAECLSFNAVLKLIITFIKNVINIVKLHIHWSVIENIIYFHKYLYAIQYIFELEFHLCHIIDKSKKIYNSHQVVRLNLLQQAM